MADTPNPVGRPTVMTDEVIRILEDAFSNGASDREACFLANITGTTLYEYCQRNPDFAERKETLKEMIKFQARKNVVEKIKAQDLPTSQWWLARKAKEEFAERSEITGADGKDLELNFSPELLELTKKLNDIHGGTSQPGDGELTSPVGTETPDKERVGEAN